MVGVTDVHRADPLEIRVLETLTSGPLSAGEVAVRTVEAEMVVTPVLEQSVVEQTVTRLKLGKRSAYSLTPKGLHAIAVFQRVQGAVDGDGQVDQGAATRMVTQQDDAARDIAVEDTREGVAEPPPLLPTVVGPVSGGPGVESAHVSPAVRTVQWRHVLYAVMYVALGVFLLLALHSAIGVASILVGLGLGAWTLRPLYAAGGR